MKFIIYFIIAAIAIFWFVSDNKDQFIEYLKIACIAITVTLALRAVTDGWSHDSSTETRALDDMSELED